MNNMSISNYRWTPLRLGAALLVMFSLVRADPPAGFNIQLAEPGLYRITYAALAAAGLQAPDVSSATLGMSNAGHPVPIWVEDGGDGRFGPGDTFEFIGTHLAGEHSYFNLHSPTNVYQLDLNSTAPDRMLAGSGAPPGSDCTSTATRYRKTIHLEEDQLRVRFRAREGQDQEIWFWSKLTQIDDAPFTQLLRLPQIEADPLRPLSLRLHFRGWSSLPSKLSKQAPDHQVEITLNGHTIGNAEWDNSGEGHLVALNDIPSTAFADGGARLEIRVSPRMIGEDSRAQVDVVLLNWIEVSYPRSQHIGDPQTAFTALEADQRDCIQLSRPADSDLLLYHWSNGTLLRDPLAGSTEDALTVHSASGWPGSRPLFAVLDNQFSSPLAIAPRGHTTLASVSTAVDYIIISHPSLIESIRPLAEFHRGRGLTVMVVDLFDIYDEFNHGITHPRAIRDFLTHAWQNWKRPAPRFVLLVGDASWDARNATALDSNYADWTYGAQPAADFVKNSSTPYGTASSANNRSLLPAWGFSTSEGHAASDNWFISDEADNWRPRMAIGRFPVATPDEVEAIVKKTIGYASAGQAGPWRRRILWITNEKRHSKVRSDKLADSLIERGFSSRKIYPASDESSNAQHTTDLLRALDEGQLLVHFYGHGGRYIWRTGPPDLEKNHDLFTLDDLELLKPNGRLPIVLSMTCYSAPFDHPSADSIGEKFLRLPGKGAVAVIAASWRNAPTQRNSQLLLDEMTTPGTVGEALMHAKQASSNLDFLNQYNLFGDPAIELPLPRLPLTLELRPGNPPTLQASVGQDNFNGRALVEWLDASGEVISTTEEDVRNSHFTSILEHTPNSDRIVTAVLAYVWDTNSGRDGMAGINTP
jgi:hypothetical protein